MKTSTLLLGLLLALRSGAALRLPAGTKRVSSRCCTIRMTDGPPTDASEETPSSSSSASLEEKMAAWEATEEEQRKATLGGFIPKQLNAPGRATRTDQPTKLDGFDVGMNISGIILFPLAIILATFPFWISSVDFTSVGPPPTS